ncbi:MAG TPA: translation elongation factor Ts [Candidatus Dormibacteraeota bacterium]
MAELTADTIKRLRDLTGAGMMDCKKALEESNGDIEEAVVLLRERGIAKAAKRAGRETGQGVVESYLHRTGDYPPQTGVLVELDCETDFVAKGDDFRKLARELAMHVAAAAPRWVSKEDVPEDVIAQEKGIYRKEAEESGRPAAALDKIVEGKLDAFFKDNVLLEQGWIREPKTPIRDLIAENVSRLQENIVVRRFARFAIKED